MYFFRKYRLDLATPLIIMLLVVIIFGARSDIGETATVGQVKVYPKLANYFLRTPINDSDVTELAKWDLLILGMQAQDVSPNQIKKIRELNPKIKILAYVLSQEFPVGFYQTLESANGPWHQLYQGFDSGWWLYRSDGANFSSWPGHQSINVTNQAVTNSSNQRWNTYLPQFMHDKVMSTGFWDGIFYDNAWSNVSWVGDGNMDINRDGQKDEKNWLDSEWQAGMRTMFAKSRQLEGPNAIILGNGGDVYKESLNGGLVENAYLDTAWSSWVIDQKRYLDFMAQGRAPQSSIINNNTNGTGQKDNYKLMRYGLGSALLDNGYYSFDRGIDSHGELWWYDEYNIDLGQPLSSAYNLTNNNSTAVSNGLWRRDFEKGVVFVNSAKDGKAVTLGEEELEKLIGQQDKTFNDGSRVNYVYLAGQDGGIFLKPLSEIIGSPFINGYYARIFDYTGQRLRGGFYTYKKQYPGSSQIITVDIDGDGAFETIVAGDSQVDIYTSNGVKKKTFYPYGDKYKMGINLALGDVNGDGRKEILTGTARGGGPQIRIFSNLGDLINPGFFAYGKDFRGGVNVAVGDLNGDGTMEVIAGAGVGGGPQIRIFNANGKLLSSGWFAYDPKFRGGVQVATGDVNSDGKDEIVSGPGFGGKPEVKVWDDHGKQLGQTFMAFDPSNRGGVKVIVNDINRDNLPEILATGLNVF